MLHEYTKISQLRQLLRVHSKGLGVICNKPEGIRRNSLVVRYLGEVYSPWYWYVKQDAIKSFLTRAAKDKSGRFREYRSNYNMDFYNILLEKLKFEVKGKEMLIIDPIYNGNYASRLSHSCQPNCCTLPTVAQNKYSIAIYAIKDIAFGEELTFNYFSFTESQKEHSNSICLCGTLFCTGHYLSYNKKHLNFFNELCKRNMIDAPHRFFLEANALVLHAVTSAFNPEKQEFLKTFSLGENMLHNAPDWLKNWAFLICSTI